MRSLSVHFGLCYFLGRRDLEFSKTFKLISGQYFSWWLATFKDWIFTWKHSHREYFQDSGIGSGFRVLVFMDFRSDFNVQSDDWRNRNMQSSRHHIPSQLWCVIRCPPWNRKSATSDWKWNKEEWYRTCLSLSDPMNCGIYYSHAVFERTPELFDLKLP